MTPDHDLGNFYGQRLGGFAGARTNPYAIQVAAQACRNFKLSINGQRRLNKALNDLPCIETMDSQLAFGWAYEHVIREPKVHEIGYEHLTITVTLAECFHESYGAEVFHQLAKRTLPPGQITPHIYQWLDLLHFTNGLLALDDFNLMVEKFVLLDPYSIHPGGKLGSADRCLVPVESFADALLALADLTSGKRVHLTLRGGGVVGWIAALAEHFFDLSVLISSAEGVQLHGPSDKAQLVLIYTDRPELVIDSDHSTLSTLSKQVSNMSVASYAESTSYSKQIHFLPFGGRVAWPTLLPQVFGHKFHVLDHEHSRIFYTAIGAAFHAIDSAKDSSSILPSANRSATLATCPPSTATPQQIITLLTAYMTSLQHGAARMERQLRLTPQDAANIYLSSIRDLATACKCSVCTTISGSSPGSSFQTPANGASTTQVSVGYCLPAIVETVIFLGLLLSRILLVSPTNPSREGVQLLYKSRADHLHSNPEIYMSKSQTSQSSSPNAIDALFDNIPHASTSYIIRATVKLFAGGHLAKLGDDLFPISTVAVAHEGMCAFAAEFAGGRGVRKDMRGMIRVVNGGFGLGMKMYRIAAWTADVVGSDKKGKAVKPALREGWQWEEVEVEMLKGEGGRLWFK